MINTVLAALGATGISVLTGYLIGAKRGTSARDALQLRARELEGRTQAGVDAERKFEADGVRLRADAKRHEADAIEAKREVSVLKERVNSAQLARAELKAALAPLEEQRERVEALTTQLAAVSAGQLQGRADIERSLKPLLEQSQKTLRLKDEIETLIRPLASQTDMEDRLRKVVAEALQPMVLSDLIETELARLEPGTGRTELQRTLDEVVDRAAMTALVLSDDGGLPLAASTGAVEVDLLAVNASLLLSLADRLVSGGSPQPLSVLLHDTQNRMLLTRFFEVEGDRYLLTAIVSGRSIKPTVLDPALPSICAMLADWTSNPQGRTPPPRVAHGARPPEPTGRAGNSPPPRIEPGSLPSLPRRPGPPR